MSKAAAKGAAKTDDKATDDAAKKAADDAAAKAADPADDSTDDKAAKPPEKKEKTYTKAELEAEKQKAIKAEKDKWEAEKDLSELERFKKENEELRNANRLRDAKDEVVAALTAAGNKSPELAFNAIRGDLKFDDGGKLINSKDLIEGLKTSYPEQFGTAKPDETIDGGAGNGGQSAGKKVTADELAKMSPAEIAKLPWEDVQAAMTADATK